MSSNYLITYGTLRREGQNPHLARIREGAKYLGTIQISGGLYMENGYPAFKFTPSPEKKSLVKAELLEILDVTLWQDLDDWENCFMDRPKESDYLRELIDVDWNEKKIKAWIYVYQLPVSEGNRIGSGDLLAYDKGLKKDDFTASMAVLDGFPQSSSINLLYVIEIQFLFQAGGKAICLKILDKNELVRRWTTSRTWANLVSK